MTRARISQGLPGLKRFRLDDDSLDCSGLGPVVSQALPDDPEERPGVAFCDLCGRPTDVVNREVLDVYVGPQLGSSFGEVVRCGQDPLGRRGCLIADVNGRHQPFLSVGSAGGDRVISSMSLGFAGVGVVVVEGPRADQASRKPDRHVAPVRHAVSFVRCPRPGDRASARQ